MKKNLISAALVIMAGVAGYSFGISNRDAQSEKNYQAACILNDACHNMMDNIGVEAEEIYYEYIDNLDCYSHIVVTKRDIESYSYGY